MSGAKDYYVNDLNAAQALKGSSSQASDALSGLHKKSGNLSNFSGGKWHIAKGLMWNNSADAVFSYVEENDLDIGDFSDEQINGWIQSTFDGYVQQLSTNEEFANAFGCPKGVSKMNPEHKCEIW